MSISCTLTVGGRTVTVDLDLLPAGVPSAVMLANFGSVSLHARDCLIYGVESRRLTGHFERSVNVGRWHLAGPFAVGGAIYQHLLKLASVLSIEAAVAWVDPRTGRVVAQQLEGAA